jgi:hypothetical protein
VPGGVRVISQRSRCRSRLRVRPSRTPRRRAGRS